MLNRRQLLLAAALAPAAGQVFAAPKYTAGKEYLVLRNPAPHPANSIEVVEFFAYTCSHCLQFAPHWETWKKKAPQGVSVRVCPVAWTPDFLPFSTAYFALEALNLLPKLHMPFFESIIYQERTYTPKTAAEDIAAFMKDNGVDADLWNRTTRSFSVQNKTRQSQQLWLAYGIDSTPMIGVGGRFTTGPHLTGSREATPAMINWLVEEVRAGR